MCESPTVKEICLTNQWLSELIFFRKITKVTNSLNLIIILVVFSAKFLIYRGKEKATCQGQKKKKKQTAKKSISQIHRVFYLESSLVDQLGFSSPQLLLRIQKIYACAMWSIIIFLLYHYLWCDNWCNFEIKVEFA